MGPEPHKDLVVGSNMAWIPRKFSRNKCNISNIDTRSGFVSIENVLNRKVAGALLWTALGELTALPDSLAGGEGKGASQFVTRSTRHTVKLCDELTVVSDGVVTS